MSARTQVKLDWRGDEIAERARERGLDALLDAGELILEESGARVPHQTGNLEGSGDVSENRAGGEVTVFYDTPYARRQHEETGWRHPNGREAKYLENALDEIGDEAMAYVAEQIRRELGG